jgi:hypothetical protein
MPEYNLDLQYNDITYAEESILRSLNPAFLIAAISANVVL